jgi:N-acylneuraminate cytidylyltransferase
MPSNEKFISAVITVRKGSQRVKNKNLKKFCDKNLLEYKILTLKKLKKIDNIIVNTDSNKAINIAKKYKVNFFKREPYYASSKCKNSDFWKNIADNTSSKYILFTHCTNPLVSLETYSKFLKKFYSLRNKYDSFNSVTNLNEFIYFKRKPINFNPSKAPNSQDLPETFKLNFAMNIITTKKMSKKKSLLGDKPYYFKLSELEGFDINTKLEFEYAQFLFKKIK